MVVGAAGCGIVGSIHTHIQPARNDDDGCLFCHPSGPETMQGPSGSCQAALPFQSNAPWWLRDPSSSCNVERTLSTACRHLHVVVLEMECNPAVQCVPPDRSAAQAAYPPPHLVPQLATIVQLPLCYIQHLGVQQPAKADVMAHVCLVAAVAATATASSAAQSGTDASAGRSRHALQVGHVAAGQLVSGTGAVKQHLMAHWALLVQRLGQAGVGALQQHQPPPPPGISATDATMIS